MALQRASLANITTIASTIGSVYTNAASTKTFVKGLMLHNTNTSNEVVQVNFVPNAAGALGTAAATNRILNITLPASDSLLVEFPYALELAATNDSIQAVTTTASKVTIVLFGDKDV